ncbi:hypothetical protein PVAP13_2KG350500 [Panicum virgatum]|uniref:Uncharacterized protein n=1 Tax=Panicum virgatum TaxID=38727 RepID=A0A8T0W9I5_PANVG|nr:hypothetical protein PVAP13_2KG350500 [Panicum virgatum]
MAYTMELEAEVQKLKELNQELERKQAEIMEIQMNEVISFVNCEAKLFYIWHIYYLGVLSDLLKLRKRYRHYSAYNHSITLSPYECG